MPTPYLSRTDIEQMAKPIIEEYKRIYVPEYHLCYHVDLMQLASILGFQVEYKYLSQDGSILGETASVAMWTTVIDPVAGDTYYFLDGKTILIEKRLQNNSRLVGRKNFTIAHELAHQIINRNYPGMYDTQYRTFCDYRRTADHKKRVSNWYEWQADVLAAALLLPQDALDEAMFMFGLGTKMKVLSRKYSQYKYESFCHMAEFFQVSKTALAYRMEHLGLLERNYLVEEAQQKRGVVCYG